MSLKIYVSLFLAQTEAGSFTEEENLRRKNR